MDINEVVNKYGQIVIMENGKGSGLQITEFNRANAEPSVRDTPDVPPMGEGAFHFVVGTHSDKNEVKDKYGTVMSATPGVDALNLFNMDMIESVAIPEVKQEIKNAVSNGYIDNYQTIKYGYGSIVKTFPSTKPGENRTCVTSHYGGIGNTFSKACHTTYAGGSGGKSSFKNDYKKFMDKFDEKRGRIGRYYNVR